MAPGGIAQRSAGAVELIARTRQERDNLKPSRPGAATARCGNARSQRLRSSRAGCRRKPSSPKSPLRPGGRDCRVGLSGPATRWPRYFPTEPGSAGAAGCGSSFPRARRKRTLSAAGRLCSGAEWRNRRSCRRERWGRGTTAAESLYATGKPYSHQMVTRAQCRIHV